MPTQRGERESGYRPVTVGLRSPRVVIVIPRDDLWHTHAATALWIASRTWGGSGFTIVGADADATCDAVLRAVAAYDPDHVVGLSYTNQELFDLGVRNPRSELVPEAAEVHAASLAFTTPSDSIAAGCSPYVSGRDKTTYRSVTSIGVDRDSRQLRTSKPLDVEVEAALSGRPLPAGLLGLMLGVRSGYTVRPSPPYTTPPTEPLDPDLRDWLSFALSGKGTRRAPDASGPANPDAWSSTETNLGWVYTPTARRDRLIVVGDSIDDFALALTWDRMRGHSAAIWVPTDILASAEGRVVVGNVLLGASLDLEPHGGSLLATSATVTLEDLRSHLDAALAAARHGSLTPPDPTHLEYIDPQHLTFEPTHHLAFVPDDFDIRLTLPAITSADGAVELAAQIPAQVPRSFSHEPSARPYWQVDVSGVRPPSAAAGRGLTGSRLLVRTDDWTVVRASRAGISFDPTEMGLVMGGASLRQSIAEPTVRFPGLFEWTSAMVAPTYRTELSEAGRRSRVCADVAGGRARLIEVIADFRPVLAEFARPAGADRDFAERDGLRVPGLGNVLTLDACARTLASTVDAAREALDPLLKTGVIRRGLVLRCGYCASRDFYSVDNLGQQYLCRRCASRTDIARDSWIEATSEPRWYYSLHGTYRDLMASNGDVPILGAQHLRLKARAYADIAEVDFRQADGANSPIEIDLVSVADGELIVAEAKRSAAALKSRKSLDKLAHVARALQADTIMLMSGTSDRWPTSVIDHLRDKIGGHRYLGGRRPRLITVTGLYETGDETEH